jgi:hypothetical protein
MNKNKAITCQISLFTRKPLIFYDNVLGFNLKTAANKVNWSLGYRKSHNILRQDEIWPMLTWYEGSPNLAADMV